MNTLINYMYRDASNYKNYGEFVVEGEISEEQIDEILDCCDCGEYFIPEQVGMPAFRFDHYGDYEDEEEYEYSEDDDHPWHELDRSGFKRTRDGADGMTVAELLKNFRKAKNNWDESINISW